MAVDVLAPQALKGRAAVSNQGSRFDRELNRAEFAGGSHS
jgi:hypothetical protein